ncbi:putative bacillithiol system thiol disulfide oxidoreductase, YpdA family [Thermobacillus composti KWC4]|uniref:Putative bacillithiol system thiol disulfide oxidoreductase, YpdA family n=1 Tax=Thermobacillus composti (strain DSM 18247 / JCM 13945 / KWC4) TaxID=717605 RepID=L0EDU1_THECK|nr:YpdA family putative bacillithiol disulfide reductase [Thermobacillus composti]AGA57831.1 putative bacillithiol system thiol disulfide oxidoreductase, YpdA family [Thermobacillus composti KWC4]
MQAQEIHRENIIIIGAGPCGLAAAVELKKIGLNPLVIEKQNVVHSISRYPVYLEFFSSPENLEIDDIPFTTAGPKPTRLEALHYYRTVALRRGVRIHTFTTVERLSARPEGGFALEARRRATRPVRYEADIVIVATGYFDHPNLLDVPGEDLPKVTHFFTEAHPYTNTDVVIVGGANSAVDAALELERVGARVTVVHRGETLARGVKPWVLPVFMAKVDKGAVKLMLRSKVAAIAEETIDIETPDGIVTLPNDFVLAMTGFHPDRRFLSEAGVVIEPEGWPRYDDETMETNVPGLYLAGVVASRNEANEIFIESGRFHGRKIAAHLLATGRIAGVPR